MRLFALSLLLFSPLWANTDSSSATVEAPSCQCPNHSVKVPDFELSFGNSQMFIRSSSVQEIHEKEKTVIPTSSTLVIFEYFFNTRYAWFSFLNLPTSSQRFIVNGEVTNERASPVVASGPGLSAFRYEFLEGKFLEGQLGLLGGVAFRQNWEVVPMMLIASRLHVSTEEGFTIYIGPAYTPGIDAITLMTGVGHRF